MSERERDIIKRISENVKDLPDEKKEYLLGVSDGMAIMEKTDTRVPAKEVREWMSKSISEKKSG